MEGTGAYGTELVRHLRAEDVTVVDVDRPDRRARRASGKSESDPVDAYGAATAGLSGRASDIPKTRDGIVAAIRALRVARARAVKARAHARMLGAADMRSMKRSRSRRHACRSRS
ncbi:hypothetical protein [Catenulispora sp. GAS73]|uniref:hypothetical protein n=1 Tax=Catenulispora sp. GAS73 TaxID=3156269 RepID=UPI003517BDD6